LLAVYHAIVDNVVTWRCLEEDVKLKTKGSDEYKELMRKTMIWLLTRSGYETVVVNGQYVVQKANDVIQCAIKHGAYEMLREIFNTKGVFRFDKNEHITRYDVTNFTLATMAVIDSSPSHTLALSFSRRHIPKLPMMPQFMPYLHELVLSANKWRDKNILEEQPMRALTTPYFRVVQLCYFILGLVQLTYMIYFSHYHMPDACSLVQLFNVSASGSNCSSGNSSDWNPGVSQDSYLWLWVIWPLIIMFAICMWVFSHNLPSRHRGIWNAVVVHEHKLTNYLFAHGQLYPLFAFCVSVFIWYSRYNSANNILPYLEASAMVFLFGWTTNLVFFSRMTQQYYVFSIVLLNIFNDILWSFLPVFLFTLLGFSFALHVLSLYSLPPNDDVYLGATVYDVFAASLGSSDYVQATRKDRSLAGIHFDLFDVVVICYICMLALILLNVLIAMINHGYDKAQQRASNFWRFQTLRLALHIETIPGFRRLFIWLLHFKRPDLLFFCYEDRFGCDDDDSPMPLHTDSLGRKLLRVDWVQRDR